MCLLGEIQQCGWEALRVEVGQMHCDILLVLGRWDELARATRALERHADEMPSPRLKGEARFFAAVLPPRPVDWGQLEQLATRIDTTPIAARRARALLGGESPLDVIDRRILPESRFSWDRLAEPLAGRSFASKDEYTAFLEAFIREELRQASLGNIDGPHKAATDVLRDLRGNIRYAVEFGGLTAESHCWLDQMFWPLHNRIVAGPPAIRLEELLALMEAGVLDISFGSAPSLAPCPERGCFRLTTQSFPSEPCDIDVLIDGRIAQPNVRTDRSHLLGRLLGRGVVRPFTNTTNGRTYVPCGIDITEDNHVVGADGRVNDTIYAMGILCEGAQLYTFVAAAPGVEARPLIEARNWAFQVRDYLRQLEETRVLTARGAAADAHAHSLPLGHAAAARRHRPRRPVTPTQLQ